jgi:glycosyltransferase involved in cell wall biosynthesis
MPAVLQDGISGYLGNDPDRLLQRMALLLADPDEARRLGENAREAARTRFSLERFSADWHRLLTAYTSRRRATRPVQGVAERTVESSLNKGTPCAAKLH